MVDTKEPDDEYQLESADLMSDVYTTDSEPDAGAEASSGSQSAPIIREPGGLTPLQRNALIVFGGFLLSVGSYKIYQYLVGNSQQIPLKPVVAKATSPIVDKIPAEPRITPVSKSPGISAVPAMPVAEPAPVSAQKTVPTETLPQLTTLTEATQSTQREISSLTDKMQALQTNVQTLTDKINTLTTTLDGMTTKLATQEQTVASLTMTLQHEIVRKKKQKQLMSGRRLFVQAVIPGRAWLITDDAEEIITVHEGSKLTGYGEVVGIDTSQGRVLTSSGKVIAFKHQRGEG